MKITIPFKNDHTCINLAIKGLANCNKIKMFYTCLTLVQTKNNYFKNKTLQIAQFQFSTAHFLQQSDQESSTPGGEAK